MTKLFVDGRRLVLFLAKMTKLKNNVRSLAKKFKDSVSATTSLQFHPALILMI